MTYPEVLEYLYSRLPMFYRVGASAFKKDLSNTLLLCDYLGQPHHKVPSIHIAGTNGKGSVSHIIASILQSAGYRTGLYTSPHYIDFRERIKVNGNPISQEDVTDFVIAHKQKVESIEPSFFEWTVALAFDYFARKEVDIMVIETGMGGRFDSTNIITPVISCITNIGWDHMAFLGDSLDKIAFEKAGIIKPGVPVIIGERQEKSIVDVFEKKAEETKSRIYYAEDIYNIEITDSKPEGISGKIMPNLPFTSDLNGYFQAKNITTALATLSVAFPQISNISIKTGLETVRKSTQMPGRFEIRGHYPPYIILDGAHNPDGMRILVNEIRQFRYEKLHIIFGCVEDKDAASLIEILPQDALFYLSRANLPRAMSLDILRNVIFRLNRDIAWEGTVKEVLGKAQSRAQSEDLILVTGSIFTVGEAMQTLL